MDYDSTEAALFRPESRPALPVDASWSVDARCAELARLAYVRAESDPAAEAELRIALAAAGYGDIQLFFVPRTSGKPGPGLYAFGARDAAGRRFVAFRGTQADDRGDLIDDAQFLPRPWPGVGRVHRGFWRAYDSLRAPIDGWLAAQPAGPLIVTGHSLGAAMATLMAGLHPDAELVTFGSPRVGGRAFAHAFAGRAVRRYVGCYDFVTNLPPPIWFRHVAKMHYVDRHGTVHSPPPGLLGRMVDRLIGDLAYLHRSGPRRGHVWLRTGADHAPINYVAAVLGKRVGP
ncbi:lipase family protein [Sphingomonas sp. RT2P30]|uniref:lipase family protein n=1 Tax=Parasphingomonas halimpatiens TaxID=3096162 RepID=UPI002FC79145